MPLVLQFPNIDPALVSVNLFGLELAIRWYALAYIAGLVLGWRYVVGLMRRPAVWGGTAPMRPEQVDDLLTWMILGVILGGRIGYVLFYQPAYFAANPGQILAVWQGGMSFHGGLLGVAAGVVGFSLKNGLRPLSVGDAVAAAAPIGICLGRIANFINGELWGRPSTVPWAVVFPGEAALSCPVDWIGPCARHPSQLYEAALEGLVLFVLLFIAIRRGALKRPGRVFGLFLIGYSVARVALEGFRQADQQFVTATNPHGQVISLGGDLGLTMGQTLSLPMALVGLFLVLRSVRAGERRA
ncbi:phosphatidylglycerol:prolipoprotein diacylglycerol transferase [Amaricoccus macauensis]|uniref:Phosphatidylglycerol--prolipoprotein diacylglyceryl transferase n=1 Tax=Amaricoccus macauensis TaxID=57001 RepID=A0A840SQD2_9RHOB|nr:prolipoprotein diacylglyceryl transferase [Amaricoccus macauensis]MBB5222658.1 phosphatidylglycerol:prolipoprotein diacylglycerol transferase [Amaricoccus macauensis]